MIGRLTRYEALIVFFSFAYHVNVLADEHGYVAALFG
jgi:hypothetical protein